jgi:coenzyme PQQ precursor peptide PqqA
VVGSSRHLQFVSVVVDRGGLVEPLTLNSNTSGEINMWTKPEFTEMRFGFEVTMYIYNR